MTDLAMVPIFPVTALSKDSKEVRDAARTSPVRITENGRGAYVFMSEGCSATSFGASARCAPGAGPVVDWGHDDETRHA